MSAICLARSEENVARIKRQNEKKISVIIGNPPYNANQLNENENNKNRDYPEIDQRIKETYITASKAQKTKRYDMYSRFLRWASDRVDQKGIVTFITNRNFLDAKEADGFRKSVSEEFEEIWIVDLGGDWKKKGRAGGANVFGIGTGVAISFLVRRRHLADPKTAHIRFTDAPFDKPEEKLAWLASLHLSEAPFEQVKPDAQGYWINQPTAEFGNLLAVFNRETRAASRPSLENALLKLYSLGVSTNRDEWLYDFDQRILSSKIKELISRYDRVKPDSQEYTTEIKWSRNLKRRLKQGLRESFAASHRGDHLPPLRSKVVVPV
jgi:predicted helicase